MNPYAQVAVAIVIGIVVGMLLTEVSMILEDLYRRTVKPRLTLVQQRQQTRLQAVYGASDELENVAPVSAQQLAALSRELAAPLAEQLPPGRAKTPRLH